MTSNDHAHHDEGSYFSGPPGVIGKVWQWMSTVDHKKIGIMYLFAIMFMFFIGGVAALLVRYELLDPVRTVETMDAATGEMITTVTGERLAGLKDIMGANSANEVYNRMFTLHGAVMVFMFIVPSIPASLGNFFLPIMLGAKDVAFPRLNLLSWYIYVFGSLFGVFSILLGGVDTGWTFYAPYSLETDTAVVFATTGAFILGFSSIFTGLNMLVTIHKLRPDGMTWFKMPLFLWAIYATAIIQILATPVLAITLLLLCAERVLGIGIFDPALGGDPVLFQHFFWFYSH
ncbi:MAG: cbb3-type cytochrome c oxidase subunit I, partial [Phycisphaerales bacterium]|nr:cbb3-type cytochrome c oxidase subunit I [Phycisphaerales bacterium]